MQSRDSIPACPAFYSLPGANSGSEQCSEPVTERYRGTRRVFRRDVAIGGGDTNNRNPAHREISRERMTCSNKFQPKRIKIVKHNCRRTEDCHLTVPVYEDGSFRMTNENKAKTLLRKTNSKKRTHAN